MELLGFTPGCWCPIRVRVSLLREEWTHSPGKLSLPLVDPYTTLICIRAVRWKVGVRGKTQTYTDTHTDRHTQP